VFGQSSPSQAGFIAQLAVFAAPLPDVLIPPPGFFAAKGLWWNGDSTNFGVRYGNILQLEWNNPWSFIAGAGALTHPGTGPTGVSGILFTNVSSPTNPAFPGYEFWIDGDGHLTVRIIHNITTNFIGVHGTTMVCDGKHHVFEATYDGSGLAAGVKLFVDAVQETASVESDNLNGLSIQGSGATGPGGTNNSFMIGNQQDETLGLPGFIGFVRMYNRRLSLSELQNFNINKTIPPIDASCVLAPKFTEGGASTTTGDDSANGFTGTLGSTTSSSNYWLRI
jgi:hypothetical protein